MNIPSQISCKSDWLVKQASQSSANYLFVLLRSPKSFWTCKIFKCGALDLIQPADSAPDDVPSAEKVRSLLKDLREARQAKSREGLAKLDHSELSVRSIPIA